MFLNKNIFYKILKLNNKLLNQLELEIEEKILKYIYFFLFNFIKILYNSNSAIISYRRKIVNIVNYKTCNSASFETYTNGVLKTIKEKGEGYANSSGMVPSLLRFFEVCIQNKIPEAILEVGEITFIKDFSHHLMNGHIKYPEASPFRVLKNGEEIGYIGVIISLRANKIVEIGNNGETILIYPDFEKFVSKMEASISQFISTHC